ncbi:T9SS type A sorting domain-containing protein [bacterium]|nr:T9SS type A sorting domain-containing protein [bacterium]
MNLNICKKEILNYNKLVFLIIVFFIPSLASSQGIINDGGYITIGTSYYVIIDGDADGDYTNQTNGTDGRINSDGTMIVEGDWTNDAGNNVFETRNDVGLVKFTGTTNQTIGGGTLTIFEDMEIDKSAGDVILGVTDNTIEDVLTLTTGALDLNSKKIIIDNDATTAVAYTNGYIKSSSEDLGFDSQVQLNISTTTGEHVFPFSVDGTKDVFFKFNLTAGDAGNVTISTFPSDGSDAATVYDDKPTDITNLDGVVTGGGDPGNAGNIVKRFWEIASTGTPTATVTFTYAETDEEPINGEKVDDMIAQRYNSGDDIWQTPLAGQTSNTAPGNNTVVVPGITTFSIWAVTRADQPLPIELLYFGADCNGNIAEIIWTTASETNNDYFTVERSRNAEIFDFVVDVPGAGNSNKIQYYSVTDRAAYSGLSYYRLKQTDFDGKFTFSEIIPVECIVSLTNNITFNVYPVPVYKGQDLYVNIEGLASKKEVLVVVLDILGKEFYSKVIFSDINGSVLEAMDMHNRLSPGIYMIIATSNDEIYKRKMVIE